MTVFGRMLDDDEHIQMNWLYDYRLELMRTHTKSTVRFRCNVGVFEAMHICLSSLRAGFLAGCKHIKSIDGCFLKGLFGGQLQTTVGIDANDCIYPVAWPVVNGEKYENWKWFLELLDGDLEITNNHQWAVMSDRQKKEFKGKGLKDQLWNCARSCCIPSYGQAMEVLKDRRWRLTGIPCCPAISALYYNKDKPEDYINECYKVSTFLAIYSHILHPTRDKNCWQKSDQDPIIPHEPANKNRARKPLLRRKEVDDENTGLTRGKGKNKKDSGQKNGQSSRLAMANEDDSNDQDPMDTFDPQILWDYFKQEEEVFVRATHHGDDIAPTPLSRRKDERPTSSRRIQRCLPSNSPTCAHTSHYRSCPFNRRRRHCMSVAGVRNLTKEFPRLVACVEASEG
ncbi:uncharacterized protein LOC120259968 [Dioscorea cayenensis subsp. rotundata]|uniref:Uncharacterized protein LOC120259968 n=1 Tax=Dioscorea cayennensis subsp. rotundata TaxID=55577 RepID=A0AB40B8H1_DIOCR|nr:uncharacterized protein LOC120259968 [Dioscorea cayenensis subsp. rotundata]